MVTTWRRAAAGRWATPQLIRRYHLPPFPPQVLFGLLLRGDRPPAGAGAGASGGGMPADSNILRMAPVGPRFSYLPVTTPTALLRQGSQLHALPRAASLAPAEPGRTAASLGLGAGAGTAAGSEVSAAAYSFANLLTGSKARAGGEDGEAAAAGGGGAAAAVGSGVASKLVGSLQGLISDQLGDMGSTLGAPGGLLSSLGASFRK